MELIPKFLRRGHDPGQPTAHRPPSPGQARVQGWLGVVVGAIILVSGMFGLVRPPASSSAEPVPDQGAVTATEPAPEPQPGAVPESPAAPPPATGSVIPQSLGVELPAVALPGDRCTSLAKQPAAVECSLPRELVLIAKQEMGINGSRKLPTAWQSAGASGSYEIVQGAAGTYVLRWTETGKATVVEVRGFLDQQAAEQWKQANDLHLTYR